jgi:hypothetical protein
VICALENCEAWHQNTLEGSPSLFCRPCWKLPDRLSLVKNCRRRPKTPLLISTGLHAAVNRLRRALGDAADSPGL